jgi:hypothetical protein
MVALPILSYHRRIALRFIDRQRFVSNPMPRLCQYVRRRRRRLLKVSEASGTKRRIGYSWAMSSASTEASSCNCT